MVNNCVNEFFLSKENPINEKHKLINTIFRTRVLSPSFLSLWIKRDVVKTTLLTNLVKCTGYKVNLFWWEKNLYIFWPYFDCIEKHVEK